MALGLGAALMTWLDVCEEVVGPGHKDVKVVAQTYYGRLLAVNGICELVTSQYVGVVSDKHGRRPVQVAAQLGQVPRTGDERRIPAHTHKIKSFGFRIWKLKHSCANALV